MNYYQKYQKYKFKYLNLLSLTNYQSGGDEIPYTEEDFILLDKYLYDNSNLTDEELEILKYYIDENNYLKDKKNPELLEDPISKDNIHVKNAVLIEKQIYDANSLLGCIKSGYTVNPHNRQIYSPANLVDIRNKLDNNENKNIIKNKIFENFSVKVRTQLELLNLLKPEQLEILFTKIKINILNLKIERDDTILNLVNYLLENNIIDENNNITDKFKNDLKKNYKLLILVPDNKITYEICMIAVKTTSYALKYIPKYNIMTDKQYYELYKEVVTQDGLALKFVPENNKTSDICEIAVTQNGKALEFVPDNNKTFDICEIAVTKNGLALEFVPDEKKTFNIYNKAVTQNSVALKHVEILFNNITEEQYYKLCEKAIENDSFSIYDVKADNMTDQKYYELCKKVIKNINTLLNAVPENKRTYEIYMLAVTNNGKELEKVILNGNITEEQYYELCEKAVENYGQAIFYVKTEVINELNEEGKKYHKPKYMTPEQYYELCKKALTNDGRALQYVHKNIKNITFEQYYKLYEIAVISDGLALEFIPKTLINNTTTLFKYKPKNMTDEQYYELCKKAVINDGFSISYIPNNIIQNMGKEKYSEIRKLAIANNSNKIPYAKTYEDIVQYIQNSMNR